MKFLTTVCAAAIGSALFRMLIPEGKLSKQVSALIAAVFLLTGITAFRGADLNIDEPDILSSAGAAAVNAPVSGIKEKLCGELSDKIFADLNERGFYPEEIVVSVNISGSYSIDITQVKLVFAKGDTAAAEAAAEYLKNELPGIEIITEV